MGIVEDKGTAVKNIQIGQRVVVAFDIACGQCEFCKREEFTACDNTNPSKLMEEMYGARTSAMYGYSHLTGGVPGGQAEYVRVPFADTNCLVIPDNIPDEKALYLSDLLPTSFHGTELAGVDETTTVGIWGLGPIGLMTARWCQYKKAKRIIGIDRVPERLKKARDFGIEVIDIDNQDVLKTLHTMVPRGLDCSIECAGFDYAKSFKHKVEMAVGLETDSADILTEMIHTTRKFGQISIIGVYAGYTNHFPIGALMEKDLNVNGGQAPVQRYWKKILKNLEAGEIDPTEVVTHKAKLSDGPELYKNFYEKKDGVIKTFLRPDNYIPPVSTTE